MLLICVCKFVVLVSSFSFVMQLLIVAVVNTSLYTGARHTNLVSLIFFIGEKSGTIQRKS